MHTSIDPKCVHTGDDEAYLVHLAMGHGCHSIGSQASTGAHSYPIEPDR